MKPINPITQVCAQMIMADIPARPTRAKLRFIRKAAQAHIRQYNLDHPGRQEAKGSLKPKKIRKAWRILSKRA